MSRTASTGGGGARGWTAVELAVVLAVLGLLVWIGTSVGGDLGLARQRLDAQVHARAISEALRAFALREARLPCPAAGAPYRENCDIPAIAVGWVPYQTLGMEPPTAKFLARYAVYRHSDVDPARDADLTRRLERTGDAQTSAQYEDVGDLIEALQRAAASSPNWDAAYVTGDGADANQPVSCSGHFQAQTAFWVVLPLDDRDGDGDRFDDTHALTGSLCAAPRVPGPTFDDVVSFESPAALAGWLSDRTLR